MGECNCSNPDTGNQGAYWLEKPCCVGRLIANTPQLERRRSMLEWYTKTKGDAFVKEVKENIVKWFKDGK